MDETRVLGARGMNLHQDNCCLTIHHLQGHSLGLRGGKGHRPGADSSSSVEGEGTAEPGPGVSVQESVSELLRKFSRSRGPIHNDSFDMADDEPTEWLSPFMTMEQVLASRDKYYRSSHPHVRTEPLLATYEAIAKDRGRATCTCWRA